MSFHEAALKKLAMNVQVLTMEKEKIDFSSTGELLKTKDVKGFPKI